MKPIIRRGLVIDGYPVKDVGALDDYYLLKRLEGRATGVRKLRLTALMALCKIIAITEDGDQSCPAAKGYAILLKEYRFTYGELGQEREAIGKLWDG